MPSRSYATTGDRAGMRFATIRQSNETRVAVFDRDWALVPQRYGDLFDIVVGGQEVLTDLSQDLARFERLETAPEDLCAPILRYPRDILCTGWNYWDHFEEGVGLREGQEVPRPEHPTFFTKGPDTVIGPTDDIAFDPALSSQWDYEAELALVFGRTGRSIARGQALDYVWGYMLANDISQRDLQRAHGGQWLKGKSIDRTTPIGPWLVTADEIDPEGVRLECFVNGVQLQDGMTSQMAFPIPDLIAELSWGMTVRAGQILLTGTPSGVGNARDPQVFLKDGDEVVVRGSGIGELRNRLVGFPLTGPREREER
jgi:2,4-didehydro-3-deoxy-L-rhamnonate hydrolase